MFFLMFAIMYVICMCMCIIDQSLNVFPKNLLILNVKITIEGIVFRENKCIFALKLFNIKFCLASQSESISFISFNVFVRFAKSLSKCQI
jgi:hypothetical protein